VNITAIKLDFKEIFHKFDTKTLLLIMVM